MDKCGNYSNSLNEKINFELNKTDLDGFIENLEKIEKVKLAYSFKIFNLLFKIFNQILSPKPDVARVKLLQF